MKICTNQYLLVGNVLATAPPVPVLEVTRVFYMVLLFVEDCPVTGPFCKIFISPFMSPPAVIYTLLLFVTLTFWTVLSTIILLITVFGPFLPVVVPEPPVPGWDAGGTWCLQSGDFSHFLDDLECFLEDFEHFLEDFDFFLHDLSFDPDPPARGSTRGPRPGKIPKIDCL